LQEVAQALHALATLRHRHARLLKALSAEAASKAPSANAIDVATCVWALGALRHHARPALAALTARMLELLPTFEPQARCVLHPPRNAAVVCLASAERVSAKLSGGSRFIYRYSSLCLISGLTMCMNTAVAKQ